MTRYYYEKAAKDFRKEVSDLQRLNNYMLLGMENMGWIKLNRDERGNIRSFVYTIKAESATLSLKTFPATLTLGKTPNKKQD